MTKAEQNQAKLWSITNEIKEYNNRKHYEKTKSTTSFIKYLSGRTTWLEFLYYPRQDSINLLSPEYIKYLKQLQEMFNWFFENSSDKENMFLEKTYKPLGTDDSYTATLATTWECINAALNAINLFKNA